MESKYLIFDRQTVAGRKTPIFVIYSKSDETPLGRIIFWPAWRKYVFEPMDSTIYDAACLTDILAMLNEATTEWRNSLKERANEPKR
jgi:hypothetical protein